MGLPQDTFSEQTRGLGVPQGTFLNQTCATGVPQGTFSERKCVLGVPRRRFSEQKCALFLKHPAESEANPARRVGLTPHAISPDTAVKIGIDLHDLIGNPPTPRVPGKQALYAAHVEKLRRKSAERFERLQTDPDCAHIWEDRFNAGIAKCYHHGQPS